MLSKEEFINLIKNTENNNVKNQEENIEENVVSVKKLSKSIIKLLEDYYHTNIISWWLALPDKEETTLELLWEYVNEIKSIKEGKRNE